MKKTLGVVVGAALLWVIAQPSAHAVILNFGVDIKPNGSTTLLPFYSGDKKGISLSRGHSYLLNLNTKSVFGGFKINSASLFIDAQSIGSRDHGAVRAQGVLLGELQDTPHASTFIPLIGGGTAPAPGKDVDNTFFTLPSPLRDQLATDSTYHIKFRNLSTSASAIRVNGINIQADAIPIPEPTSLALFGLGGLGALGLASRRKRVRAEC